MDGDEIAERLATLGRIFDSWPTNRPANRNATLVEYVNATRGVPIEKLARCVELAIAAGGDFMPAAGEVLRRAAGQAIGGPPLGTDRDERFRFEKRVAATVRCYLRESEYVEPLVGGVLAAPEAKRLVAGR